jgi:NADH:ubiquinone oxidoreductase subunit K
MIEGIGLTEILVVSTLMFFLGVYGFITRKNLITMLMSTELILNAATINFAAINVYLYPEALQGHFFSLFIIAVAAAEVAVAIAIVINLYRNFHTVEVEEVSKMKY